eukprot:GHVS01079177.1.p1 GENE.GHVS01079177.1~~GHVS01079177.1.p1  ORF type:complete len:750 (+),score=205.43 GHVS01079177.1:41-2290(+)
MDRSVLNRATAANDQPTPGYLYNEIAAMTLASPEACQQLEDYLLKRMERSDDPNLLLKCLRVAKHVCEKGSPDFRRSLQRKADRIRSFQTFRGKPDTLKGDQPGRAVREEAEACLKALYGAENTLAQPSLDGSGRIQGFGSETGGGTTGGGEGGALASGGGMRMDSMRAGEYTNPSFVEGGRSGKMQGFGSPYFNQGSSGGGGDSTSSTKSEQAMKYISETAARYLPETVKHQLDKLGIPQGMPTGSPPSVHSGGGGGYSGGGFGPPTSFRSCPDGGGFGRDDRQPWGGNVGYEQPSKERLSCLASTGELETKLVADLCAPCGAKMTPPPLALAEFVRKSESLDSTALVAAVARQLRDQTAAVPRFRAVCLLEALLRERPGSSATTALVAQQIGEERLADDLRAMRQKGGLWEVKVSEVLRLMGEEEKADQRGTVSDQRGPLRPQRDMDLLDMGGGDDLMTTDNCIGPLLPPPPVTTIQSSKPQTVDGLLDVIALDNCVSSFRDTGTGVDGGGTLFDCLTVKDSPSSASFVGDSLLPPSTPMASSCSSSSMADPLLLSFISSSSPPCLATPSTTTSVHLPSLPPPPYQQIDDASARAARLDQLFGRSGVGTPRGYAALFPDMVAARGNHGDVLLNTLMAGGSNGGAAASGGGGGGVSSSPVISPPIPSATTNSLLIPVNNAPTASGGGVVFSFIDSGNSRPSVDLCLNSGSSMRGDVSTAGVTNATSSSSSVTKGDVFEFVNDQMQFSK